MASEIDDARKVIQSGDLEAGAKQLISFLDKHPNDKGKTPQALLLAGEVLDRLEDLFSERAEISCYWERGSENTPACMQGEALKLNEIYGDGAFKAVTDISYIPYSGIHYKKLVEKFPNSKEAARAEFKLLLKDLVGHPDIVLPKIKKYLEKYPKGDANLMGLLLWARVNEDIWYIHREWSWVLYNDKVSPEDLIIRAEPYRQEAMNTYKKLLEHAGTFEGKAAKRELKLLKENQTDGETYSILADTVGGKPEQWGDDIPPPKLRATGKTGRGNVK